MKIKIRKIFEKNSRGKTYFFFFKIFSISFIFFSIQNNLKAEDAYEEWMQADEVLTKTRSKRFENEKEGGPNGASTNSPTTESRRVAPPPAVRRFHEVLDELFAEFAYDIRMGQIKNLKNLSIRKVEVSASIPNTYESYLELSIAERIRENSQIRLISCLPCKSKASRLVEGKLMITSPQSNINQLGVIADQLGIESFMDIVLVYHTTHMVLGMSIFDAKSKDTLWSRTYNSETVKSRYQKLAVDYSQVEVSRPSDSYVPEYRLMYGLGGALIPNVGGGGDDNSFVSLMFRGSEKFNNRKSEFGLIGNIFASTKTFTKAYPTVGQKAEPQAPDANTDTTEEDTATTQSTLEPSPFKFAIMMNAIYARNFLGKIESYDEIRHGIHGGLGFMLAPSYFAPTARIGWDGFFGRRFALSADAIYVLPSKILFDGNYVNTKGGVGGELVFSLNY